MPPCEAEQEIKLYPQCSETSLLKYGEGTAFTLQIETLAEPSAV